MQLSNEGSLYSLFGLKLYQEFFTILKTSVISGSIAHDI